MHGITSEPRPFFKFLSRAVARCDAPLGWVGSLANQLMPFAWAVGKTPFADFERGYRLGESLHFIVAGIGEPDAGIEIRESSSRDDYYAKFGLLHQCVIVSPGEQGPSPVDQVFVSPRTGKIHRDWVTCGDDK